MIKPINLRGQGTEKFGSEGGGEALLPVRTDYRSDEQPLEGFWKRRQANATGQRRYRRAG